MPSTIPDLRHISNGRRLPSEGYADQPYLVKTDDGGEERQFGWGRFGWGRFSPSLRAPQGASALKIANSIGSS